jgi:2-dehydropantoate 2-reductase
VEVVAEAWREAGFTVRTYDDLERLVWEKLVCNVAFSATCALTGMTIGAAIDDPDAWSVVRACATEAYEVARAKGIGLPFDDPVAWVREFGMGIRGARPSMLLDVLAGRPTEVDVINGAIPPLAAQLELAATVNTTVTALVHALERTKTVPLLTAGSGELGRLSSKTPPFVPPRAPTAPV